MALPELTFSKTWTAPSSDSSRYLPTVRDAEDDAREDLQVQHDDTASWAGYLVDALGDPANLGIGGDYSGVGANIANVKEALESLHDQISTYELESIADNSVTSAKLTNVSHASGAAVATNNIQNGAVTSAKLSAQSTEQGTIAAVATANIQDNAVTHDKLSVGPGANAAVQEDNIKEDAVTTAKIADDAVTSDKLNSTSGSEAVTTNVIRDGAVTAAKLDDTSVVTTVNGKVGAAVITKFKTATVLTADFINEGSSPTLEDYPWRAAITDSDATASDKVYVEFNASQINAGIYAPMTMTWVNGDDKGFYIYASEAPSASQTIAYTILKA